MSWWEIKDARSGVTLALLSATHIPRHQVRGIGDRISTVVGGVPLEIHHRTARPNPTLVHHGIAQRAQYHLLTGHGAPLADLYVGKTAAEKMAHALADHMEIPLQLVDNDKVRGLPFEGGRTIRGRASNPKRKGRKNPAGYKLTWQLYGAGPGAFRAATGIGDYYVNTQRAQTPTQVRAGSKERGRGKVVGVTIQLNTHAPNAKGFHWTDIGAARSVREAKAKAQADWDARSSAFPNPSRSPRARASRRAGWRKGPTGSYWVASRKERRAAASGHVAKQAHYVAARARRRPNPKGRVLSVPERHQLKIARDTLRMSDAGARIMGGPTKAEAREIIYRLTGREPVENARGNPKVRGWIGKKPGRPGWSWELREGPYFKGSTLIGTGDNYATQAAALKDLKAGAKIRGHVLIHEMIYDMRPAPNRRRKGRVTANPRSEMARAKKTYEMWSEMKPGAVTKVRAPKRVPKVMARLGELHSVVYKSDKYDGKSKLYEHKTKRPRPVLATDPDGRDVFVVGGRMKVTADGLVN